MSPVTRVMLISIGASTTCCRKIKVGQRQHRTAQNSDKKFHL